MEKETISIYTIAKEAGVSPATVSRVLTGNAKVSEDKKSKVQALIRKYDFRPNALARGLSSVETKIIGLMVSDIRNPFYATMAVECEKEANKNGYLLMLCNSLGSNEMEVSYLEKFSGQGWMRLFKLEEKLMNWYRIPDMWRISIELPIQHRF